METRIRAGVRRLFRLPPWSPARAHADADDELASFLDARTDDLVSHGSSVEAARAESIRRLGLGKGIDEIRDQLHRSAAHREERVRAREWMQGLTQDIRFALRQLAKARGFTTVAVLSLALGIGATTAIFSVVYSVLLRPLPFAHAERLLSLRERVNRDDGGGIVVTAGNYSTWAAQARDFEAFGAYSFRRATLTGTGEPQELRLLKVSAGFWKALYVPPMVGRYFGKDEDRPGAPMVIVLSQALWKTTFGADPHIAGRTIVLSGQPYTVIGVAPAGYEVVASSIDAWTPLALSTSDLAEHADHELEVIGRIREGISRTQALAELTNIETSLAKEYPGGYFDGGIIARPLLDSVVGSARTRLLILLGAVMLVLLIACANIASLLLARAGMREKEIAVRGALGAGRARVVRQLLVESLVLAFGGAVAGLAVAAAGVRFLVTMTPEGSVPRLADASLNLPVLAFTLVLALGCGILFGLYPALRIASSNLQRSLAEGSREAGGAMSSSLRKALVVGEIAVAIVLMVAAGLLVRSAILVQHVNPGFDPQNVLIAGVSLPDALYPTDDIKRSTWSNISDAVGATPGVANFALASRIPINGGGGDCTVRAEGAPESAQVGANVRIATPGFLDAMRIPLVRGRFFTIADAATSPRVVVINRGLAHRLFGDADPIGRRLAGCKTGASVEGAPPVVVGVMGDIHANGLQNDVRDELYFPLSQLLLGGSMNLVVRGAVPVTTLAPSIKRAVARVEPQLPVSTAWTMERLIASSLSVSRFTTLLLVMLGVMGLLLAVIGIYGVIAYSVSQRRREIGVRMALGSTGGRVVRLVVKEGLMLAAIGIIVGCGTSLMVMRVISSMLYQGVSARDPVTIAAVAALIGIVAVAASSVPAWRAARVAPVEALRG